MHVATPRLSSWCGGQRGSPLKTPNPTSETLLSQTASPPPASRRPSQKNLQWEALRDRRQQQPNRSEARRSNRLLQSPCFDSGKGLFKRSRDGYKSRLFRNLRRNFVSSSSSSFLAKFPSPFRVLHSFLANRTRDNSLLYEQALAFILYLPTIARSTNLSTLL